MSLERIETKRFGRIWHFATTLPSSFSWIINPADQAITVYFFQGGKFAQHYTFDDTVKVNVYDDLEIALCSPSVKTGDSQNKDGIAIKRCACCKRNRKMKQYENMKQ